MKVITMPFTQYNTTINNSIEKNNNVLDTTNDFVTTMVPGTRKRKLE